MASFCRSALMAGSRSVASRSRTLTPKNLNPTTISSLLPSSPPRNALRVVSVMASMDSMMPLHSAIASARLISSIAVDSSCWSMLSQGFATPL